MKGNSMRKVLLVLAGMVAILGFFAPTASAGDPSILHSAPVVCHSKNGIQFGGDLTYGDTICTQFHWRYQNDGSGVYLEGMNIWVDSGCHYLESHPVTDINVQITGDGIGNGTTVGDMNDCTAYRDLELRGADTGGSDAYVGFNVAVDHASDYRASHTCEIHPNNPDNCFTWHN